MKECELCRKAARMYCEADQASLCFECDDIVHGANFLVARHTRCLLCTKCQEPTPWKASGSRLGTTVDACGKSVWGRCRTCIEEIEGGEVDAERDESEDDFDYEDDEEVEEEEEEDEGEIQVVPLSKDDGAPAPPVYTSSSASEESSFSGFGGGGGGYSFDFKRGDRDLDGGHTSKRKRGI